jgi:hypothetical protein
MPNQPAQQTDLEGRSGALHVFSTIEPQRGEVQTINLKPSFSSMRLPGSAFKPEFRPAGSNKIFDAIVGGGRLYPDDVWIFMGETYVRYNLRTQVLNGPVNIAEAWAQGQWPDSFRLRIDAAVTFTNEPEFMWFFRGANYFRYHVRTDALAGGPVPIVPNWPGWPESWADGIDAAVEGRGPYEGMAWFFKGSEYIRYNNLDLKRVDIGPTPIGSVWNGWPASFTKVDCAICGTGQETSIVYFFRGDRFIAYDLDANMVVGPPSPIEAKWPQLAAFMRRPQLFFVDHIQLKTFYGDMSAGDIRADTQTILPRSEEMYTVVVTRRETQTISDTMTVLESQDQSLVTDVNKSMRREAASANSSEQYGYQFDSSFEGELDYTGLGGEVSAALSFQGSSNDVRNSASKASVNAVNSQVAKTENNRRQSTRVIHGDYSSSSSLESTYKKTVHNPTASPITVGVFQLLQKYLCFVVLSDVRVAFSNGGRPDVVPVSRLDSLLDRYIVDGSQAAAIRQAIVTELKGVLDHRRRQTDVLKQLNDGRYEFDAELTSHFAVTNTDGTMRREIAVPGLILDTETFTLLTEAAFLKELSVS